MTAAGTDVVVARVYAAGVGGGLGPDLRDVDGVGLLERLCAPGLVQAMSDNWRLDGREEPAGAVVRGWVEEMALAQGGDAGQVLAEVSRVDAQRVGAAKSWVNVSLDDLDAAQWVIRHRYPVAVAAGACTLVHRTASVDRLALSVSAMLGVWPRDGQSDPVAEVDVVVDALALRQAWEGVGRFADKAGRMVAADLMFGTGERVDGERAALYAVAGLSAAEARQVEAIADAGERETRFDAVVALAGLAR